MTMPPLESPPFPWARACRPADAGPHSPFSGQRITETESDVIRAEWARWIEANRVITVACGMAWWKRDRIGQFLWSGARKPLHFADDTADALAHVGDGLIAVWPSRAPAGLIDAADGRLVRIEDGFIRSIGLGAAFHPPLSVITDREGIYYDPNRPSELETILRTTDFPPAMLDRAEGLRRRIVAGGISKYGVAPAPAAARAPNDRRTVLVCGQVEDDMSVLLGGGGVAGNLDLLVRARAAEPDAHILFKPHPDVDAGHRKGRVADSELLDHADAIVRDESMPALLGRVDAVHVLTSLAGFEALLRGLEVSVHGRPFYAGWGLTRDFGEPLVRRTRRLSLPQLIAGALILYPRYIDPVTLLPCPPEILLDRFASGWRPKTSWLIRARQLQGRLFKLLGLTTD